MRVETRGHGRAVRYKAVPIVALVWMLEQRAIVWLVPDMSEVRPAPQLPQSAGWTALWTVTWWVIGASTGCVEAISTVAAGLPADFPRRHVHRASYRDACAELLAPDPFARRPAPGIAPDGWPAFRGRPDLRCAARSPSPPRGERTYPDPAWPEGEPRASSDRSFVPLRRSCVRASRDRRAVIGGAR